MFAVALSHLLAGATGAGSASLAAIGLIPQGEAVAAVALPLALCHPAIRTGLRVALGLLLRLLRLLAQTQHCCV